MFRNMFRLGAGALAVATAATSTAAQDASTMSILEDLQASTDITVLAKPSDPTVRKANAVVNGDVVTDTDVDQRLNLVLAANGNTIEEEERSRLRLQIMRNLIDEKLQIQESAENDIFITDDEVDNAYQRVAGNFNMEPTAFAAFLKERGTSRVAIRQQIHAELAWQRLLRRRVQPLVNVGDDEVESLMARMEASKGEDEFRIGELVLFTTPETAAQTMTQAEQIVGQLRQGASFVAYSRQYSQSSTATLGGDLGWVRLEQLPPELQPIVAQLPEGQMTNPVQIPGAIVILALIDKRQVLTANEDDAVLSLKQMNVVIPAGTGQAQAETLVANIRGGVETMRGCGDVETVASRLGAEVTVNDNVRLGDLPPQLKPIIGALQIGQSTPPFGSMEDGIKVLTMCGREDPQTASAPNFDNMFAELEERRVNMMARRYLRDLRRDAIIDYR
ncbi:MAG: peptidylprolyl isomerase [Pseudomonadota bacterium]